MTFLYKEYEYAVRSVVIYGAYVDSICVLNENSGYDEYWRKTNLVPIKFGFVI